MKGIKTAVVTGGSSGLGFDIAKRFLEENFQVIITGRNKEKLLAAANTLGDRCHPIRFDMTDLEKMPSFVKEISDTYGSIDVLVNNAGVNQKKAFLDTSEEDFNQIITTNQTALFSLSREVAKLMLQQASNGSIINISSMAAHYGIPKVISYTASKAAVEGMTMAMAVELGPMGIRVNSVAPGFIKTPMSSKALDNDAERKQKVLGRTPLGKLGLPRDIANAVYFLSSDQASYITGVSLKVDGGNSIGF